MSVIRRIALVGLPGSGKSTLAPLVAERLGWDAVDLDNEVAATTGRSPAAIIAADGEARFRDLELAALEVSASPFGFGGHRVRRRVDHPGGCAAPLA